MQQRIRDFLRVRTSYDVLPLSFRLIIFDTALLVKKSLTILIQNGNTSRPVCIDLAYLYVLTTSRDRHRFSAVMGFEDIIVRGIAHHFRLPQPHPVLLAEPRGRESDRPVQAQQPPG